MPFGFNKASSDIESVVGIQFSILSPDEIRKGSVVEITTQTPYEGNEPKIGGLFDPRMGVLENGKICRSCGQTNHGCPGHFGHYELIRPVYFFQFLPMVQAILRCICVKCSKLLIEKDAHKDLSKRKGEARWREVLARCKSVSRCGQETEDGCGAPQPSTYKKEGIARIEANFGEAGTQPLDVEYVLRLFRRITDEDVDFMGFNHYWCRPDWMICQVLLIPPPQVRPSVVQDNNQRSEDDLTHKLFEIIKYDKMLQQKIENNAKKEVIEEWTNILQYHIATLVDNQIPGVAPSAQRSGRPLKSLTQRLGAKEGRIRYNIQGKRVEFSARSVITPDPNLSIAELGVPEKIAMNLTVPERVTPYNREKLYKFVQNGADKFPGAKTIVRTDGRMISLRHINTRELVLHHGDIVNRHLMDGDILLFNRQPTLHRMSMMGHRVRVLPYNTFRLNVSVTSPYNADFDGDEMNAHAPQSLEASVELEDIAAVPHQIITPRHGKPVISIVQDSLLGSFRICRPDVTFNRREYMDLMMFNRRFSGQLPAPQAGTEQMPRWTGQQVISSLLPPINLEMKNGLYDDNKVPANFVKIKNGVLEQGIIDKNIYSKPSSGIIHTTYNDYGPQQTVELIDSLQSTISKFLVLNGFSVGISDLIADEGTRADMDAKIQEKKKQIAEIILQVHLDLFDNNTGRPNQEEFESRVLGALNEATKESGAIGIKSLADDNRLMSMVRSGSKGGPINVSQMMACVGQQNIEGKRIPNGFQDRTLPHYKKYDDGAEARGFIESSFIRGLTPQEFFFHAMSGREGLIDTAVKSVTADTEIVIMEDGQVKHITIGEWTDRHLAMNADAVQNLEENNMEYLDLATEAYIPTTDADGNVTWGLVKAVTRHDPGHQLYQIKTRAGKEVTVTAAQSLLIWNEDIKQFLPRLTTEIEVGQCVPVTASLPAPPSTLNVINVADYLPKTEYLYGTDFVKAIDAMAVAMEDREHIPTGWWKANNGSTFTLPYDSKARLQRATKRSNTNNIRIGYVYPFTTNRDHALVPEVLPLDNATGIFIGLFLAEGNVDIKSGYVQITNNDNGIRAFVNDWFAAFGIRTSEEVKTNHIGGTSSCIRGYSVLLAKLLTALVGYGAANKHVPSEAFAAPEEFILGLLNGYFSGDGTISNNSVETGSVSRRLIDGISMLCTRIGIFGKTFMTQLKNNNLGTETIQPTYRLSIRGQWAFTFAKKIVMLHADKQNKLKTLRPSSTHRNFTAHGDVVLDTITEINPIDPAEHPKMYDLTVPSTFNFGLANGLQVRDTADTGYIQRQMVKGMEDLLVQHDGTVRDAGMNIVQYHYGEDGINATKIESLGYSLGSMTRADIEREFGLKDVDLVPVLAEGVERIEDTEALKVYVDAVLADRRLLVEKVYCNGREFGVYSPVNLQRLLQTIKVRFDLVADARTDLTPAYLLSTIDKLIIKTQTWSPLWSGLLRFWLNPSRLIVRERFTKHALDMLCEVIITKNWQSWVVPGEQVGILAAQSIGEPSTQMVLNTFHLAGVASKSNVTGGLPRLKELLKVTQNPKATSLSIKLKREFRQSKEKAREVCQQLELTLLRDISLNCAIYYDPKDENSVQPEDRALMEFYALYEQGHNQDESTKKFSPFLLRLELNREKMFDKNISMYDVAFVLRDKFPSCSLVYSDYNSQKLVMRIRVPIGGGIDNIEDLKKYQSKLLNGVILRGAIGMKAVAFSKDESLVEADPETGDYAKVEQYVLDTDGSNFQEVMNHPAVDGSKLYSTNVHDLYEQYGIEAARIGLLKELTIVFEEAGVNVRHLGLLVDVMTRSGRLMSMDRYGINKRDIGPLAKASFEETGKILLKASLFGEVDPVTGVSANITTGQPIRGGTAFSQILLDEAAVINLYKGLGPAPEYEMEDETDFAALTGSDENIYGTASDACSAAKFQMSIQMPPASTVQDEDDISLNVLSV